MAIVEQTAGVDGVAVRLDSDAEHHFFVSRIAASIDVKRALQQQGALLATIGAALAHALRQHHKLIFFGNGGSAADAQHLAAEFVGRYQRERRALPALALNANTSSLTAIANDYAYEQVFARQIEAFGAPGDVAVAISTSGTSANVLAAVQAAKRRGLMTVGMTGAHGGALRPLVDHCLCVPSHDTARIQEAHILVGHLWCDWVEHELF